jgi:hypothetical protein
MRINQTSFIYAAHHGFAFGVGKIANDSFGFIADKDDLHAVIRRAAAEAVVGRELIVETAALLVCYVTHGISYHDIADVLYMPDTETQERLQSIGNVLEGILAGSRTITEYVNAITLDIPRYGTRDARLCFLVKVANEYISTRKDVLKEHPELSTHFMASQLNTLKFFSHG